MNAVDLVVVLAYASLVVEITVFPIPSEASTWQLLGTRDGGNGTPADPLQRARTRPPLQKVLCYFLPTAIGVLLWLLPLACVFVPALGVALGCTRVTWLVVPGLLLLLAGRVLTFASVLQLRAHRRTGGGPRWLFRRSRNPGLVGMFACYLGLCCLFASPLLWLGLPLYVANMHGRVAMEEAHLGARLGAAWTDYASRVPRYVGWRQSSRLPAPHE